MITIYGRIKIHANNSEEQIFVVAKDAKSVPCHCRQGITTIPFFCARYYLSFDLWLPSFRSIILLTIPKPPNAAHHFEEKTLIILCPPKIATVCQQTVWFISFLAVNGYYFVLKFLHKDLLHSKISATRLSTMNSKTAK